MSAKSDEHSLEEHTSKHHSKQAVLERKCHLLPAVPTDPLNLVLEKVIPITDYIRFGAVCKRWKSAALHQKQRRLKSCHNKQHLPMLLIPRNIFDFSVNGYNEIKEAFALYSVEQGMTCRSSFELKVSDLSSYGNMKCFGSSHGWLIYGPHGWMTKQVDFTVILLNPFTGGIINLERSWKPQHISPILGFSFIKKVVLSADPSLHPNDFEAPVLSKCRFAGSNLALFRSREDSWSHISCGEKISDVIHYKGQYLGVNREAKIFSINFGRKTTRLLEIEFGAVTPPNYATITFGESSKGDLLLFFCRVTDRLRIMKLMFESEERLKCVEISENIGSDALFLGRNQSMCLSVIDYPKCHPNSIYINNRILSLEDNEEELKRCSFEILQDNMKKEIWVTPTMVWNCFSLIPSSCFPYEIENN